MPGRTLATWYGTSGERTDNNYPPEPPYYPRTAQPATGQYAPPPNQYDSNYYYQSLNQTGSPYPEHHNYPPSGCPQQYSPQSPSSPIGSYSYPNSQAHHEMSYPNSQGAYNPNPSPGHYTSPNHVQGGNYPSGWTPQQSATDYTPSPAHTSAPVGMPGQYPAHHPGRHPALAGTAPPQGHGHPAWSHTQQQGLSVHPGAVPLPPQAGGYFPAVPQLAHMGGDRHSPHPAWGGKTAASGGQSSAAAGPGNPLFSLQMLVNQSDMNRAAQANPYRGPTTSMLSETVDLSTTTSDTSQASPISLTRSERPSVSPSLSNGSIPSSSTSVSKPPSSTAPAVKSPLMSVNGDASSDSGISSSTPTPSGLVEVKDTIAAQEKPTNLVQKSSPQTSQSGNEKNATPAKVTKDISENTSAKSEDVSVVKVEEHLSVPQQVLGLSSSPVRSPKNVVKRTKKVDSILENLVESGSIKPTESGVPTPVIASVITSCKDETSVPEASKEDVAKCVKEEGSKSPEREEISPTNIDDDSGKPRRKRKLDKPLRLSKTDEVDGAKPSKEVSADAVAVEPAKEVVKSEETGHVTENPQPARRRSSSERSEPSSSSPCKRERRKSESDQMKVEPPSGETSFNEVENELEKMFAGIEGMEEAKPIPTTPVVTPRTSSSHKKSAKSDKRGRPKGSKNEPKSSDGLSDVTPENKKSKKRKKSTDSQPKKKGKAVEEKAKCDETGSNASSGKIRGPLIRLTGPRESPCSVNVYNAPSQLEEGEKPAKTSVVAGRRNYSDLDYRGKLGGSGPGMFTSTLSSRYDSHTRDPTWLCAFCKRGPHSNTSAAGATPNGDLFGPYVVARERADGTFPCVDSVDDKDISAEQKKGGKNKKSLRQSDMVEQFKHKMSKKAKRAQSFESVIPPGLTPLPAPPGCTDPCYEAWVHEDCALWASGTRIVGSRIYGLQDAIWGAVSSVCAKCGLTGANIGCIARSCPTRVHFHCGQQMGWDLDETTYIARCARHDPR